MITTVHNLSTGEELFYSLEPRDAVVAAYAQTQRNDWSTWEYERRYGHKVKYGKHTVICGDCCAMRSPSVAS